MVKDEGDLFGLILNSFVSMDIDVLDLYLSIFISSLSSSSVFIFQTWY